MPSSEIDQLKVARFARRSMFIAAIAAASWVIALPEHAVAGGNKSGWVTVYYPHWAMGALGAGPLALPPWEIDWTGITHVVHFFNGNVSTVPPYSTIVAGSNDSIDVEFCGITRPGGGPSTWIHWQDSLLTIAHRNGAKVLLTIQAVDPTNLNYVAADSARADTFATYIVGYMQRKGYDGLELDWEGWASPLAPAADVNRLVRRLRAALDTMTPHGLLAVAAMTTYGSLYWPSQDGMVDQYNLMCYDYAFAWNPEIRSNSSWYVAPLHRGTGLPTGFEGMSYDTRGPLQWIAAGHDPAKVGVGIPTFGWVMKDVDGIMQAMKNANYGYAKYQQCIAMLDNGGSEGWDDERKVPYIAGTALRSEGGTGWREPGVLAGQKFFATYENPRSMQEKAIWVRENNLGGIMLYDLTTDLDPTKPFGERNPLVGAAARAYSDPGSLKPFGMLSANPAYLPPGGGSVELNWRTQFSSSQTITPAIGAVTTVGSVTLSLAATTTFALDLDGPGGKTRFQITVPVDVPPSGAIVFDDSLHAGFLHQSWGVTAGFQSTEKVWSGKSSIRLDFSAWGGFKIGVQPGTPAAQVSSDIYDSLRFDVYCDNPLSLAVTAGSGTAKQFSLAGGAWQKISVGLSGGAVPSFSVQNNQGSPQVVFVDNIYFAERSADQGGPGAGTPGGDYFLEQNYPNPFNSSTVIEYTVPRPSEISIEIYNVLGEIVAELASGLHFPGRHRVTWNASGLSTGVYICRLKTPETSEVRRLVYIK